MERLHKATGCEICYTTDHLLGEVVETPCMHQLDGKRLEDAFMTLSGLIPSEETLRLISACLLAVRIAGGIESRGNSWS